MDNPQHILTVDQGNTSAKLALWAPVENVGVPASARRRQCCAKLCIRGLTADDIQRVCREYNVSAAIWCSVSEREPLLLEALRQSCDNIIELTVDTPTPLAIDYTTPQTLGVDRLAAAVGAYTLPGARGRDILVSDLGTAITYDHVTASGRYVGGNIAPGIWMRLCALNHYTARLPQVETDGDTPLWGHDTASALRGGAINGVVAELEYYHSSLGDDAVVVLTGGAVKLVEGRLSFRPMIVPDLVSEGLEAIMAYNGL